MQVKNNSGGLGMNDPVWCCMACGALSGKFLENHCARCGWERPTAIGSAAEAEWNSLMEKDVRK